MGDVAQHPTWGGLPDPVALVFGARSLGPPKRPHQHLFPMRFAVRRGRLVDDAQNGRAGTVEEAVTTGPKRIHLTCDYPTTQSCADDGVCDV